MPRATSGDIGAQTLDLGRPCVNAKNGASGAEPKTLGRSTGQNGGE